MIKGRCCPEPLERKVHWAILCCFCPDVSSCVWKRISMPKMQVSQRAKLKLLQGKNENKHKQINKQTWFDIKKDIKIAIKIKLVQFVQLSLSDVNSTYRCSCVLHLKQRKAWCFEWAHSFLNNLSLPKSAVLHSVLPDNDYSWFKPRVWLWRLNLLFHCCVQEKNWHFVAEKRRKIYMNHCICKHWA